MAHRVPLQGNRMTQPRVIQKTVAPAMCEPPRIQTALRLVNWLNNMQTHDVCGNAEHPITVGRALNRQEETLRATCMHAIARYVTGEDDYQNYLLMGDQSVELGIEQIRRSARQTVIPAPQPVTRMPVETTGDTPDENA